MPEPAPAPAIRPPGQPRAHMVSIGVEGRRRARFSFAVQRANRIIDGDPKLTADELRELAAMYAGAAENRAAS